MYTYPPLIFQPHTAPSVSWSSEGRVALLTGQNSEREIITILNPSFPISQDVYYNLQKLGDGYVMPSAKEIGNSSEESEVDSDDIETGITNLTEKQSGIYAVSAAWSPPGLGKRRESVLAWIAAHGYLSIWDVGRHEWTERWNLQKLMEDYEYEDWKTRRMWKLRRRAAQIAWARPFRTDRDTWPKCFLSVSNMSGELVVFRATQTSVLIAAVTRFGIFLDEGREGEPLETTESAQTGRLEKWRNRRDEEDMMNAVDPEWREDMVDTSTPPGRDPRPSAAPVGHIAWSPWIKDKEGHRAYVLGAHLDKAIIRTAVLREDGSIFFRPESTVIGEAWTPEHLVTGVAWFKRIYRSYLVFAYAIQMQVKIFHWKVDSSEFVEGKNCFVETHSNDALSPVSGMEFLETAEGLELHYSTMGGNMEIIKCRFPEAKDTDPSTEANNTSRRSWKDLANEAKEEFKIAHDIPYGWTKIYGLAESPMGSNMLAAYTTDPDWSLIYKMTAHQKTHIAFGEEATPGACVQNYLQQIPSVYELPAEGFISEAAHWGEEGFEALKQLFRKRGFRKDLDVGDVEVIEEAGSISDSLARNIFLKRSLNIVRYQSLVRFLPYHLELTGKTHSDIVLSLQYEPAVVAHLVANILSVPEEYITSQLDISCYYAALGVAIVAFYQVSPILDLVNNALKILKLRIKDQQFKQEHDYIKTRKSGKTPQDPLQNILEKCKTCEEPLLTTDLAIFECENSHRIPRCSITFLPIYGDYKKCGICERPVILLGKKKDKRKAVVEEEGGEVDGDVEMNGGQDEGTEKPAENNLDAEEEGKEKNVLIESLMKAWDVCPYCGGMYLE